MFGLSEWKQTRFYQEVREETRQELKEEVKEETKLETIPELLKEGLTVEQIARVLKLDIKMVRKVANQQNEK